LSAFALDSISGKLHWQARGRPSFALPHVAADAVIRRKKQEREADAIESVQIIQNHSAL
jgi:hypothetical protein